jgi:FKBP-type peptidyl-prolyl cis-trans isomerase (trigger factor)
MIQAEFLVMEVAKQYDLDATEEDFQAKIEEYAKQTGIELARVFEYYSEPNRKNQSLTTLTREKVVKFLSEKAIVTEIDKIKDAVVQ